MSFHPYSTKRLRWRLVALCCLLLSAPARAANFVVSNLFNGGAGSLRQAILDANAAASDDVITFSVNGTITLSSALPDITNNGNLTITGNGAANTVIQANTSADTATYRILYVDGGNLSLGNVTLRHGGSAANNDDGGCAYVSNGGTLGVSDSIVEACYGRFGGGLGALSGTLTVSNSIVRNNFATRDGGGIQTQNSALTVTDSTVTGNLNINPGNNGAGGGVSSVSSSPLLISGSTISNNSHNSSLGGHGGGLYISSFSAGSHLITHSRITGNSASPNHSMTNGGGIYLSGTNPVTVVNTLIANNTASNRGGGIYNGSTGALILNNVSISGNGSTGGGALTISGSGATTLNNTIIADSTGADCLRLSGTLNAYSSLIEDGLGCVNGAKAHNLTGAPALDANFVPTANSPVTNAGDNGLVPGGVVTDLAGNARIQALWVDMGAFESAVYPLNPLVNLSPATASLAEGGNANFTLAHNGDPAGALTATLAITPGAGMSTADYSLSGAGISGQSGTVTVTVPAGLSSTTLNLAATADGVAETDETLDLALVDGASYNLGPDPAATVTIGAGSFQLTLATAGSGSGSLGGSPAGAYAAGAAITLGATPAADSVFAGWSPGCSASFNMPAANLACTATFNLVTYTVTPAAGAGGSLSPATPQAINSGAATSFTVTPNANQAIASVSGCGGSLAGNTYTTAAITGPCTVSASFTPIMHNFATATAGTGSGSIAGSSGAGSYAQGTAMVLAAAANAGSVFAGWSPVQCVNGFALAAATTCTATFNLAPGIAVTPTSGLVTSEIGGSASFTVVLRSPPGTNVTLGLGSSNTAEGTVSPASLTFTPADWNVPRTVTVTGVADAAADGPVAYSVNFTAATSADPAYTGMVASSVALTNVESVNRSYSGPTATGTGTATLTIAGGGASCGLAPGEAAFITTAGLQLPGGTSFPHGAARFRAVGCTPGSVLTVSLQLPAALMAGTVWKLDAGQGPWQVAGASVGADTLVYTVQDGGPFDADGLVNGEILDPVGFAPGGGAVAIPALDPAALAVLMLLVSLAAWQARTRRRG